MSATGQLDTPLRTNQHDQHRDHDDPVRPSARLDPFELAEIAEQLGESLAEHFIHAGDTRRWRYVVRTDRYEAVAIAWPAGTGLRMHDHDGSAAAIHVVGGRLRERYIDAGGVTRLRWLEGGTTTKLPSDHVHEVINLDDAEVVSLHVYSPPLGDTSFRTDKEICIGRPGRRAGRSADQPGDLVGG